MHLDTNSNKMKELINKIWRGFTSVLVLTTMLMASLTACHDDPKSEDITPVTPTETTKDWVEIIIGKWLLASSTSDEWITYEFTETARIKVESRMNNQLYNAQDFYFLKGDSLTANYTFDTKPYYLDWIFQNGNSIQIDFKAYNDNTYIGANSLYAIVGSVEVFNEPTEIDYTALSGDSNVSNFKSLDSSIASVDSKTGMVTGVQYGTTFVTFTTSHGTAAVKINVSETVIPFAELIKATWIYDCLDDNEWQKTIFADNNYIYVNWREAYTNDVYDEADGSYSIDGTTVSFSVVWKIYGRNYTISQIWETEAISYFDWAYSCYSDGSFNGKYTGHRLLDSITLTKGNSAAPTYSDYTKGYPITGYSVHDTNIATVTADGKITAVGSGRTYVEVETKAGAGVVEVNVE